MDLVAELRWMVAGTKQKKLDLAFLLCFFFEGGRFSMVLFIVFLFFEFVFVLALLV